jgi:hypothetical protein
MVSGSKVTAFGRARAHVVRFLALVCLVFLWACGGGGEEGPGCTGPQVDSSPPTDAKVGFRYSYTVWAPYICVFFGPNNCPADVLLLQAPSGASVVSGNVIVWDATQAQVGTNVAFVIATNTQGSTECHSPTQSWSVHVDP